jgi:integrase
MPRPATGTIVPPKGTRKSWAIRYYPTPGRRVNETLGRPEDGWNRSKAEGVLRDRLDEIRLDVWKPKEPPKKNIDDSATFSAPSFHEFAEGWFEANQHEWSERTRKDYRWALELHVLPFFADYQLGEISIEIVDRFRAVKLREAKLAPAQINKCLKRLSQILELAEEYELIPKNPARGKRRRAKEPPVRRTWVEPEQAMALIEQASWPMRPVIATLIGSGLRVGELAKMEWGDVSLATGTIKVREAKTEAGSFREVDLPAGLVQELTEWKMRSERLLHEWQRKHPDEAPVFLTKGSAKGGSPKGLRRQSEGNISARLKTAIRDANKHLAKEGIDAIPERVTPHSLRRTYASIRAALKDDPLYVSEQMGHRDVRFTLNVYSRAVKRRAKLSGAHLAEFDRALAWAELPASEKARKGTKGSEGGSEVHGVMLDSA